MSSGPAWAMQEPASEAKRIMATEMAQQLDAYTALAEDQDSVHRTLNRSSERPTTPVTGDPIPSSGLHGSLNTGETHKLTQANAHRHKNMKILNL